MIPLVLASRSPYRRALLERLQLAFTCAAPDIDETRKPGETPVQLVQRLSEQKARAVAVTAPGLIIGSDQIALLDGEILGKPGTHEAATEQLNKAAGRSLQFLTGLCLLNTTTGRLQIDAIPYSVVLRRLTPEQIERYLRKDQPYDCAGSFKAEQLGIALFEREIGDDPTALVGLPLIRLITMLLSEGISII